jgi:hypothetical protein
MNHNYDARVTLKTYLPVKKIGNKFLVLPGHHNGYSGKRFFLHLNLDRISSDENSPFFR